MHELEATRDFDALYAAGYRSVLRAVVLLSPTVEDAQDLAAEAWTRAYDRWDVVGRLDEPLAWVRRVAVNAALDVRRRETSRWRAYRRWGSGATPVPETDATSVDVVAALRRLKPAHRRAVVLHYLCDRSVAQIATDLGLPEATVKTHLSRGRTALAALLRNEVVLGA